MPNHPLDSQVNVSKQNSDLTESVAALKTSVSLETPVPNEDDCLLPELTIVSVSRATTGYATTTNHLVRALTNLGVRVRLVSLDGYRPAMSSFANVPVSRGAPKLFHHLPVLPEAMHDQFLVSVFEVVPAPPEWEPVLGHLRAMSTPSKFATELFRASYPHIAESFTTIPHAIDLTRWAPVGPRLALDIPQRFKFLNVSNLNCWDGRKNVRGLVEAFCQEFTPAEDVALVLKVTLQHGCLAREVGRVLQRHTRRFRARPNIYLLEEQLPDRLFPALYRACDCYATANRGEGFGRTPLEAMALGLLSIGPRHGGSLEFMSDANALLVDVGPWEELGHHPYEYFHPYMCWRTPQIPALRKALRRAFDMKGGERARYSRAARAKAAQYSFSRMAREIVAWISVHSSRS